MSHLPVVLEAPHQAEQVGVFQLLGLPQAAEMHASSREPQVSLRNQRIQIEQGAVGVEQQRLKVCLSGAAMAVSAISFGGTASF